MSVIKDEPVTSHVEISPIMQKMESLRKKHQPFQIRVRLLKHVDDFAHKVNIPPEHWSWNEVLSFIHEWDGRTKFECKQETVRSKFQDLTHVFAYKKWSFFKDNEFDLRDYKAIYMRYRYELGHIEKPTVQAKLLSMESAKKIVHVLLSDPEPVKWKQQLKLVRILALCFTMVGGARVADLGHIRWGNIFEREFDGHPVLVCHLDWNKTDPLGVKGDHRLFPMAKNEGLLCPVRMWRCFNTFLPKTTKATGPFISMRSGEPFLTNTILQGWRRAAEKIGLDASFGAHSPRRSRITMMRDNLIPHDTINAILGYRKTSKMAVHYDELKRAPIESNGEAVPATWGAYLASL